jgi:cell division protein FtsQ
MSRSGTRQSSILSRRNNGSSSRVIFFAKRFGAIIFVSLMLIACVWAMASSGFIARTGEKFQLAFIEFTASRGFVVKNVMIEGRDHLTREGLKTLIAIDKNEPLFAQDLGEIHANIQSLSWVKSVIVERHLPDTLYIRVTEREPIALWQRGGQLSVVDDEGVILTSLNIQNFKHLIVIVGEDAPQNTRALLGILDQVPHLKSRVDAAKWIGNRRWDLTLNNKIIVRLPEDKTLEALQKLMALQANDDVLSKPLSSIDLRDDGRIIVQTKAGDASKIDSSDAKLPVSITPPQDKNI